MRDFRGQDIHIGDTIVYAGRKGSSLWFTEAVVTSTRDAFLERAITVKTTGTESSWRAGAPSRTVVLSNNETVVVIAKAPAVVETDPTPEPVAEAVNI